MKISIILMICGAAIFCVGLGLQMMKPSSDGVKIAEDSNILKPNPVQTPSHDKSTKSEQTSRSDSKSSKQTAKEKGNDFESYVADILKSNKLRIKEWNQGLVTEKGAIADNALNPDFFVEDSNDSPTLLYWVECKYRSKIPDNGFTLEESQVDRYQKIQRNSRKKILIALGSGGKAANPNDFYIIPLDSIVRYKRIPDYYLRNYKVPQYSQFRTHIRSWFLNEVFKK